MQQAKENLSSIKSDKVSFVRSLKDAKARRDNNKYIIEGESSICDISDNRVPYLLYATKKALESDRLKRFIERYNVDYYVVTDAVIKAMSDTVTPCGALLVANILSYDVRPIGKAVILDGISDPGNLGTIIRTAAACSYNDIYLISCADVYAPKVVRSTMSALGKIRPHKITADDIEKIFGGYEIIGLDMGGVDIFGVKSVSDKRAIVIGSEAHGISASIRDKLSFVISLKMTGDIESLNAAVAGGIVMYILDNKN